MKTTFITLATLFILSLSTATAENYTTFKISDHLGRTMEVFVKTEKIEENFAFNTREIFIELKSNCKTEMIDLTPFIKPETEVIEDHPVYIGN
jgi:hypothetical protein